MTKEQMDHTIILSSMLSITFDVSTTQLIHWFDKPFMNFDKTPRELILEDKADILLGAIYRMATGEPSS
jgi:hypothetical protein